VRKGWGWLWAWSAALFAQPLYALDPDKRFQDYAIDNWGIEHGLPQVSALSVVQDARGYLWVGTQNGIARFDGVRFTAFDRRRAGVDTTMATFGMSDRQGRLWFATPRGALHFDGRAFALWVAGERDSAVHHVVERADGSILLASERGVLRAAERTLVPHALPGVACFALLAEADTVWVGARGRVIHLGPEGATREYALPAELAQANVTQLLRSDAGLLLGTTQGLLRLHDGVVDRVAGADAPGAAAIESLARDNAGTIWVGTAPVLYRWRQGHNLEALGEREFLRNSWITAIVEDREGNLWFGSRSEGLFRLWNGWATRIGESDGLGDPFVWSIARGADGEILLGTNSQVARLSSAATVQAWIPGEALPNPAAYNLFVDHDRRLWVGTRSGLALFDGQREITPAPLRQLIGEQINNVTQVGPREYWIGTSNGLYRWRDPTLEPIDTKTRLRVRTIYPLSAGRLLIGAEDGVREWQGGALSRPAWAEALNGTMVTSMGHIGTDVIGIGTLDAGFGLLREDRLIMLDLEHGLPSNNAWAFEVIGNALYVSSIEGVYRIPLGALPDPRNGTAGAIEVQRILNPSVRVLGELRARCCNGGGQGRMLREGDALWLPTVSGALRLDVGASIAGGTPPVVLIEELRHGTQRHEAGEHTLGLGKDVRDVEISFTAFNFRDPRGLSFRYRLDGYDQSWREAGAQRTAYYTNLPAGTYRFRVRASNASGMRNASDASLAFELLPRWYEQRSTQLLAALALLGLIAGISGAQMWAHRRRQRALEAAVAERTRELRRANERLREANLALAEESQTDALTGLRNRRFLFANVEDLLETARGQEGGDVVFMLVDLDHFKHVNDRYGHGVGDVVLTRFAELLRSLTREHDYVVRWGGEEFLLVLRDVGREAAAYHAEWIRTEVQAQRFAASEQHTVQLTCSVGYSMYPPLRKRPLDVPWSVAVELADAALYQVKAQGRNGWSGLLIDPDAEPAEFAGGVGGRVAELTTRGRLRWVGVKPRLAPVKERAR
jgi:diguanylate cyclase (GGDEF)-like protein